MNTAVTPVDHAHAAPVNCPNCDTVLTGHFCSHCGQEAILHHASVGEFLHEFIGHYVALEGKLWGTVMRLLFRPGALTLEYIRGRRVRFVQPLRLYLTLSLLFFALLKFSGTFAPNMTEGSEAPQEHSAAASKAQDKASEKAALKAAIKSAAGVPPRSASRPDDGASAEADQPADQGNNIDIDGNEKLKSYLDGWPAARHQLDAFDKLSGSEKIKVFQNGFYHYAPYAIFALMPVFALLLKVLYLGSGRRFGDHLLFALHTNAFAYFIFILMLLVSWGLAHFVLWCWLLGYLPWAMRRVYNSGRGTTLVRWLLLMFFYSILIGLAVGGSMLAGIMTIGH
ncbi:DUF3667 domain-containing protein [Duganella qianjiadongensis]|uniref:DUF3667 domain-containing protein n=1 Tax=Duganella qianjiadongensis TaxID=2692176 RepID=A0ABW9VLS4_9BURK|nr:DUF3667 domain-containing protein [Duganella qianjiadongensis]MYM40558.1 DUF3667 domain-containing protein [Duganella qianjiadongensis]